MVLTYQRNPDRWEGAGWLQVWSFPTEVHRHHHPRQDRGTRGSAGGLARGQPLLAELTAGAVGPELLYAHPHIWRESTAKKGLQTMNN